MPLLCCGLGVLVYTSCFGVPLVAFSTEEGVPFVMITVVEPKPHFKQACPQANMAKQSKLFRALDFEFQHQMLLILGF